MRLGRGAACPSTSRPRYRSLPASEHRARWVGDAALRHPLNGRAQDDRALVKEPTRTGVGRLSDGRWAAVHFSPRGWRDASRSSLTCSWGRCASPPHCGARRARVDHRYGNRSRSKSQPVREANDGFDASGVDWVALQRLKKLGFAEDRAAGVRITAEGRRVLRRLTLPT